MNDKDQRLARLEAAYQVIVDELVANTEGVAEKANFEGTPLRAAKALLEVCKPDAEIRQAVAEILDRVFPVHESRDTYALGMVTQGPIYVNSLCPHHLYPVRYAAFVSYLPKEGRVLGLSKLARLAKILGQRPVLHEQLASDIADCLHESEMGVTSQWPQLRSSGSAVMLVGTHTCEACRGIQEAAKTSVTELRGVFWEGDFEQKFYKAVEAVKNTSTF